MANGRLANLKESSFTRTDPVLATRIGRNILHLPTDPYSVWDPSSGTGSLFYTCAHTPWVRLFGTEISAERAQESRLAWPHATIVTAAFEAVTMQGKVDLVVTNPPYFQQNGKRAALHFVMDAGASLREGGIMVAILTARADWDGYMINHWLKWYDSICIWKFPDRTHDDQEGAFDDFKQIVVVGVRRETPAVPASEEKRRLQGYQWRNPEKFEELGGWRGKVSPPDLPDVPIDVPYHVPTSREVPRLVVRNADEATLLYALDKAGAHLSPVWQKATTWPESGYLGSPAMPYTGEAHVAAEIMIGGLDGEIVSGPDTGKDAEPHLFTAFVGQEWYQRPIDEETKQKLHEQGCVHVEMQELSDKPILGVLNLVRGTTHYYQGEEVFRFLHPWLPTLASRVVEKRKPLYQLDPSDWELRVTAQFGLDKQLPKAPWPGLAVPQQHRVFAMGRSLDVKRRTAIQGEPGTGKTRMATATAARQAYRWRQRNAEFKQSVQPSWIKGLRRAWLKNPRTLDMLGLEPVYGWHLNQQQSKRKTEVLEQSPHPHVVAYRETATGRLLAPEDAGPRALPVLITTPLKVIKEYDREIRAAFPQAEVMHIESHRDIERWFQQCATSRAPVIFGIFSHSTKQAFGRRWRPAVHEKVKVRFIPEMHPDARLKPLLEPVYDERKQQILGYQVKATGKLLTRKVSTTYFYCPTCGGRIDATPGRLQDKEDKEKKQVGAKQGGSQEKEKASKTEPVGSITWFVTKQRWCKCKDSRRVQDREARGKSPIPASLWQDDRTEATNRKSPQCSFAQWSSAWNALGNQARHMYDGASMAELVERVRRDDTLLTNMIQAALTDPQADATVAQVVERVDAVVSGMRTRIAEWRTHLSSWLFEVASGNEEWLQSVIEPAGDDDELLIQLVACAARHEPDVREQLTAMLQERDQRLNDLLPRLMEIARQDAFFVSFIVETALAEPLARETLLMAMRETWPHLQERLDTFLQHSDEKALARVISSAVQYEESVLRKALSAALRKQSCRTQMLEQARGKSEELDQFVEALAQDREAVLGLVVAVAQTCPEACREMLSLSFADADVFADTLSRLAQRDMSSLLRMLPNLAQCDTDVRTLAERLNEEERKVAEHYLLAARRDSSNLVISRLIEATRTQVDWQAVFFRLAYEQLHVQSQVAMVKSKRKGIPQAHSHARTRLTVVDDGPISREEWTHSAAREYDAVRDSATDKVVAYQMGTHGHRLTPVTSPHSGRVVGYTDALTGTPVKQKVSYDFRTPPSDSFSPYDYLYRFFKGCVGLAVVDESHNGRSKDADISQAFRQAMRASQTRELTSGTHYGGDIIAFYHYWFSYHPQFWIRLGFGWNDAEQALQHYGVIQQWTKEYESDARRGSGQTNTYVSTIPAPGLSAKLIPGLLEDLTYLTVLDVGAHMPPKKEIPKGLSMRDPLLVDKVKEAEATCLQASKDLTEVKASMKEVEQLPEGDEKLVHMASAQGMLMLAEESLAQAQHQLQEARQWVKERDLAAAYDSIVSKLERMAREGNTAARLAQGTISRWFAALPCDSPYEVFSTERDDWGNKGEPRLVIRTPVLAWNHVYPMERYLIEMVQAELKEQRTVMIYIEQITRSMAKRLEWVLAKADISCWTLSHGVEAEDRQQAILDAFNVEKYDVVIVPYRLVNEGLNLHNLPNRRGVKTIIWYEQSMNLFMYLQASQRAWRLGADDEVRIYLPFYAGTAAHTKMRKLGGQSGAAAAFAGEPAKGELIKRMGADQTTLARLSASLEDESIFGELDLDHEESDVGDDLAQIEAAFARRNDELADALKEGRQWLGVRDQLPARLAALMAMRHPDLWSFFPSINILVDENIIVPGTLQSVEETPVSETLEQAMPALPPSTGMEVQHVPNQEVSRSAVSQVPHETAFQHIPTSTSLPVPPRMPELLFGDEEAIRLARKQRGKRPRRTLPRLKNPTIVKEIPAELPLPTSSRSRSVQSDTADIVVTSWWEMSFSQQ